MRRWTASVTALVVLFASSCSDNDTSEEPDDSATTTLVEPIATTTTNPSGAVSRIDDTLPGQCLDDLPETEQQPLGVIIVPCSDPHTYEVFAQQDYRSTEPTTPGAAYPGELVVSDNAEAQCIDEFEAFIGVEWQDSDYDVQAWWPSAESWNQANDRTVTCAVFRINGELSKGTARDSGV